MKTAKSWIMLLFGVALCAASAGCGQQPQESDESGILTESSEFAVGESEPSSENLPEDADGSSSESPELDLPAAGSIDLTEYSGQATDENGYKQSAVLRLSKAIAATDSSAIESAWSDVGGTGSVPCIGQISDATFSVDSMAVVVGTLELRNDSPGTDGESFLHGVGWFFMADTLKIAYGIAFSNEQSCGHGFGHNQVRPANWSGDTWGPVPFVIAVDDVFTPNHPEGDSEILNKLQLRFMPATLPGKAIALPIEVG